MIPKLQERLKDGKRRIVLIDDDYEEELRDECRVSALKQLLRGDIRKRIASKEQELKAYAEMRNAVMTRAVY